jgi:hypothetical protein
LRCGDSPSRVVVRPRARGLPSATLARPPCAAETGVGARVWNAARRLTAESGLAAAEPELVRGRDI